MKRRLADLDQYLLIAGVVSLVDYEQNPECFGDLILSLANVASSSTPVPNADDALEGVPAGEVQIYSDIVAARAQVAFQERWFALEQAFVAGAERVQ
jgi:hypothetical protein